MKYTAKEIVNIFKEFPEDEIIYMWYKFRGELHGFIEISEKQWSEVEDDQDLICEYINMAIYNLVSTKVEGDEGGLGK
jgi:hypothetical protein